MPQLDVSTYSSQIFWLIVSFGILCIFISTYIAPRIGMNLHQRTHFLEEQLALAKRLLEDAERLHVQSIEKLSHARHEASQQLQKTIYELNQERAEKLREFDQNMQAELAILGQSLAQQKDEILKSADTLVNHIVEAMYNKVTGANASTEEIQKAIKT